MQKTAKHKTCCGKVRENLFLKLNMFINLNFVFFLVHSFLELVPKLLQMGPNVYFLSDKINQDPIEEHFGRVRMRGGCNENPTQEGFGLMNRKIVLIKSDLLRVMRGNTRGRISDSTCIDVNDERQLPKRSKKNK